MEFLSEIESSSSLSTNRLVEKTQEGNRAWFMNMGIGPDGKPEMIPFGDVECMTIETFCLDFTNSNSHPQFRFANIGHHTIDVQNNMMFLTTDPDEQSAARPVVRGASYKRSRPDSGDDSGRFIDAIIFETLADGKEGDEYNFLGNTWFFKHNNGIMPSLNQIKKGILTEAMNRLKSSLGCSDNSALLDQAYTNICKTWNSKLFGLVDVINMDQPLKKEDFQNSNHPICILLQYIYTLQTFIYSSIYSASTCKDASRVSNLGPFVYALSQSIDSAPRSGLKFDMEELYRKTFLPESEIQKYRDMIVSKESLQIIGFVSTSLDRKFAESFSDKDKQKGKKAVLYKILMKSKQNYCQMDISAYIHEKEVLLSNGTVFEIVSLEKDENEESSQNELFIIILNQKI